MITHPMPISVQLSFVTIAGNAPLPGGAISAGIDPPLYRVLAFPRPVVYNPARIETRLFFFVIRWFLIASDPPCDMLYFFSSNLPFNAVPFVILKAKRSRKNGKENYGEMPLKGAL